MQPIKPVGVISVFGDTHGGGTTALMPKRFRTKAGQTVQQSKTQAYVWECYADYLAKLKRAALGLPVFGAFMGDATEGNHHGTVDVLTIDDEDHENAGYEVIQPWADACKTLAMIAGTPAHVGNASAMESRIARRLIHDGYKVITPGDNTTVWPVMRASLFGINVWLAHHGRASGIAHNRANWISGKLRTYAAQAIQNGDDIPNLVTFGHTHRMASAICKERIGKHVCDMTGLISGCWQLSTGYGHKIAPHEPPDIGAWIVTVYENGAIVPECVSYPSYREDRQYVNIKISTKNTPAVSGRAGGNGQRARAARG